MAEFRPEKPKNTNSLYFTDSFYTNDSFLTDILFIYFNNLHILIAI